MVWLADVVVVFWLWLLLILAVRPCDLISAAVVLADGHTEAPLTASPTMSLGTSFPAESERRPDRHPRTAPDCSAVDYNLLVERWLWLVVGYRNEGVVMVVQQ